VARGEQVYWTTMKGLVQDIKKYKEINELHSLFKKILQARLLIRAWCDLEIRLHLS
jgi:hypothetical protein